MESASRQVVSEELRALGDLPSEAELSALIERYAGSRRVSCEQADLFFASLGEVVVRSIVADPAEVARGSWLDKLGPRSSSAPPAQSAQAPALSMATMHEVMPEEPITIEQALEHLPPTTYSSAPPPSALPSRDSAPVALPLSSRPAPQLTAADSVVVERWGMAETTPQPAFEGDAEEDALLDQWSDGPAAAVATDAPERWSAPHLAGETVAAQPVVGDDDAPLSAAELSLLEQWSAAESSAPGAEETPAALATNTEADPELDVELEDEIELEPDDLIEIDSD